MSEILQRRETHLAITLVCALLMFIPYFFHVPMLDFAEGEAITTQVVIASFAAIVGCITMTRRQYSRIRRRVGGWYYAAWMLFGAWYMIIVGLIYGRTSDFFRFGGESIVFPGDATIYSIIVFYMTSACARSFRSRNLRALLLMIVAFFVLLTNAPIGAVIWPGVEPIGSWFMNNLVMSANRVFAMGVTLGAIALAVRTLSGREIAFAGLTEEES